MAENDFYLIGHPLGHSFSPRLHQLFGNDRYALMDLAADEVGPFLESRSFAGLNVTIPYKQAVLPYLAEVSPRAQAIGAINTVKKRPDGSLYGDNTDVLGFLALADRAGVAFEGKNVVILGTGGTSLTARYAVRSRNAKKVTLVSRSGPVTYRDLYDLADTQVLINTTPVGMHPNAEALVCDPARFPALTGVLDVIYNPLRTRLVQKAQQLGLPAAGGLSMLFGQGRAAAEQFSLRRFSDAETDRAYAVLLSEKLNIVLCGMPGCGKTSVGQRLSRLSGRPLVDTDALVAEKAGMPIPEIFERYGEERFRDLEEECIRECARLPGCILSTGGGCVKRESNRMNLRMNGRVYRLLRPLDALDTRGRPLSRGGLPALKALEEERTPLYRACADREIDNSGTVEAAAVQILEDMKCAFL